MKRNIRYFLDRMVNSGECLLCGLPAGPHQNLCRHCWQDMPKVPRPCPLCGLTAPEGQTICPRCLHKPPPWASMTAPLAFRGDARRLLLQFKFNEQLLIANSLVSRLWRQFNADAVDVLIPVPLHRQRFFERGFNQSLVIARQLGWRLDRPVDHRSLQRIRPTDSQTGLSRSQRQRNLRRAFDYRPQKPWQRVALIDDVITTGSTMEACCHALRQGGVEHIEIWSLARRLKHE